MNTYTIPQRMLNAAICAYSIDLDGNFNSNGEYDKYLATIDLAGEPKILTGGVDNINAGFIATTNEDPVSGKRWIILSFRGTLGTFHWDSWKSMHAFLDDWLQDDATKMELFSLDGIHIGKAEKGFKDALCTLWSDISSALSEINLSDYAGIQITGHSKGAAMTFLAASFVKVAFPAMPSIHVHAFAAPLAGDPAFASWYRANHLDLNTTRYQKIYDIVPFIPPSQKWNIFHHLPWSYHPTGVALEALLKVLGMQAHGGYEEVGNLVALTTESTSGQTVNHADTILRTAIVHAIGHGEGKRIASAHSATDSYWPAMFDNKSIDLDESWM